MAAGLQRPPKPTEPPTHHDDRALVRRDLTAAPVSRWSYLGCFEDSDDRILSEYSSLEIGRNSAAFCCDLCTHRETDYSFCGVEVGDECYCDFTTYSSIKEVPASECNSRCGGDTGAACGGHWRMGLYQLTDPQEIVTSAPSATAADLSGYSYEGCYTDRDERIVGTTDYPFGYLDPQFCCDYCVHLGPGYPVCGVEAGRQCFCGSTIAENALRASSADCNEPCSGAKDLQCGAEGRINVYSATAVITTASTTATATSSSTPQPDSDTDSDLSDGAIAGVAVAGAAVLLLLAGLFFFRRRIAGVFSRGVNTPDTGVRTQAEGPPTTQYKPESETFPENNYRYYPQTSQEPSELDATQTRPVELNG